MSKDMKTIAVNADTDGDNLILSLPGQKREEQIVLVGYMLNLSGAGTAKISTVDGTTAFFELKDPGASYPGTEQCPAFKFPVGHNVEITAPAGVDINGHFTYFVD